jgi:2'-5' RNA ligase
MREVDKAPKMMRMFFALWPERGLQQGLHRLAHRQQEVCGGRAMRSDALHMTLLFMGPVDSQRLPQLLEAAARVQGHAFSFALQRFVCWKHNHIGFAAPAEAIEALSALVNVMQKELEMAGFNFDHKPFAPHVTLLRNIERLTATQELQPLPWNVKDFVLVASETTTEGSRYRIVARWPLRDESG